MTTCDHYDGIHRDPSSCFVGVKGVGLDVPSWRCLTDTLPVLEGRWSAILACMLARSLSLSLLERRPVLWIGGDIPSVHEVLRDARFG